MNRKRIIAGLTAIITAAYGISAAAENLTIDNIISSASGATVTGHIDTATARPLTVQVIMPGGMLGNISDVYRVEQIETDSAGNFTYTVSPDDTDFGGIYTIYIGGRDISEPQSQTFTFISYNNREETVKRVSACKTASELKALLNDEYTVEVLTSLGFDNDEYLALPESGKDMYCSLIIKSAPSVTDFSEKNASAIALAKINSAAEMGLDSVAVFRENAAGMGIDLGENTISEWLGKEKTDALISSLLDGKTYNSQEEIYKAYNDAVCVKAFDDARWNELEKVILLCNDYLKLDTDNSVYKANTSAVYKLMVNYTYNTVSDINTNFEKAVKAASATPAPVISSGGGLGGGGSSSGGSSYKTSPAAVAAAPAPVPQNTPAPAVFGDMGDADWARSSVERLYSAGVVAGDGSGSFYPNRTVTREEYVKMLVCAFGINGGDSSVSFSDVKSSDWFLEYIEKAASMGIITGKDDGSFGTGENISREDMAVMILRALSSAGISLPETREGMVFTDNESISQYAAEAVDKLYRAGIISGFEDGSFAPKATATRAQAAVVISSAMQIKQEG